MSALRLNRTLGFLRRNIYSCPQEVKEAAYNGLVRPVLDYGSSVWDLPGVVLQEELESVQKHAARFVTGNYSYNWEYDWHSWTIKMGIPQEKDERQETYIAI